MTVTSTHHGLVGAWRAELTFLEGPRAGPHEPVRLTFLPEGVIIHADEIPADNGQVPRGIGEWTADRDRFSYWFNVVLNEASGRPAHIVYVHGQGTLAADGQALTASGGSDVYAGGGQLLATNRADLHATRAPAS